VTDRPAPRPTASAPFAALARSRRSVRGFLPDPVPASTVARLLETARSAPSGANLQPGRFIALAGAPLANLTRLLGAAIAEGRPKVSDYSYFPDPMPPYLKERQRAAGYALYAALGIDRRDLAGRRAQFARNYRFFDAPVGIVVTLDRAMGAGCYMDLGMALQTFLLAAHAEGLAACGIGALANHADVIHDALNLPADDRVICGLALGYEDPAAPENQTRTDRAPLSDYATFLGFPDAPDPSDPAP
jgi:nitroreductase